MKNNRLFSVIPENFFVPLSYSNKKIYLDVIFLINKLVQNGLSYGIDREIIVDAIEDYLNNTIEEIYLEDEEGSSHRDKANSILRKLVEYGWIYIETTNDYKQIINFNDYSVAIIEAFKKIMNNEKLEYQGSIISIYSLLFSNEDMNRGIIIKQVFDNTKALLGGLKTLNANIKKYMDDLTKKKTPEEIMEALFGDYAKNIIDKAYHRLKTSENVAKYRPRIIDKLEELANSNEFLCEAGEFYKEDESLEALDDGVERVKDVIYEIINAFNNLDDIIDEIDSKNTKYQRAAVTRAKFLLNNSKDVTGQIKTILSYACDMYKELELKLSYDYLDELTDIFTLYSYGYIDETALYTANEGKKSFKPQKIQKKSISNEERENKLKAFKEKQDKIMSISKINAIVMDILSDKKMCRASDISIDTIEDFIKIVYIRVLCSSPLAKYKVVSLNSITDKCGYTFRNFEIWRK